MSVADVVIEMEEREGVKGKILIVRAHTRSGSKTELCENETPLYYSQFH